MNPVILADNVLGNGSLVASSTDTGYDVLNLRDRKTFTKWKPTVADYPTAEITLDGAVTLSNASFETDGDADGLADNWGVYNNSGGLEPVTPSLVAGYGGGNAQRLTWSVNNTTTKGVYPALSGVWQKGGVFRVAFRAKASGTNVGQTMDLRWNVPPASVIVVANPALTGDWQLYDFKVTWGSVRTDDSIYISIALGTGTQGTLDFDTLSIDRLSTVSALAFAGHNLAGSQAWVVLDSSSDGSSWTTRLAGTLPSSDKPFLRLLGADLEFRAWRVQIAYWFTVPSLAVCYLGKHILFPFPPSTPYRPLSESIEAENARSKDGQTLDTIVRFNPYSIQPRWRNPSRSWVDATLWPFWTDWGSQLKPYFWAWDLDAYPNDVRYVSIEPGFTFEPTVSRGASYDEVGLNMVGVRE